MAHFLVQFLLLTTIVLPQVHAADDLCTRSTVRTCSDNNALEQLFLGHGSIYNLNCNFTLSATLDGVTFPYSITYFDPTNPRSPIPVAGFGPASQGPIVNFTLTDKKMNTFLVPFPANGGGQKDTYHDNLMYAKTPDKDGSSNVYLMGASGTLSDFVELEGALKFQCVDGTVALVLIQPYGKIFVADSGAFQKGYSSVWLVDEFNGRAANSGGIFKKIEVVVHIAYE